MKKILLALAVLGFTYTGANAQSSANSKFAKNYPVCLVGGSYQICGSGTKSDIGRTQVKEETFISMETTTVHMGRSTGTPSNTINRGRIRVSYDDMNDPYVGQESMANDGVKTNIYRNLNYLDTGVVLPSNDGGVSNR